MVLETSSNSLNVIQGIHMYPTEKELNRDSRTSAPRSIDDCLEIVVSWIEKKAGKNYFLTPLEEFQANYGKVNPEDDFYQARMNYFLEHCVLERPMTAVAAGRTPLSVFIEQNDQLTSGDDTTSSLWRRFCGFRHSLFQIEKSGPDQITIKDLLSDKTIKIYSKAGETLKYLARKSIFQGFIFGQRDEYVLGQGLIIHPDLASKEIHKFLKRHRKYPRFAAKEVTRMLAQTNMKYMRMQHVDPAVIYQAISL
jgi:hypothetical protein